MSEEEKKPLPETPEAPPQEPVVYASPLKRVWAWVGAAYMVIVVLLMTYQFAYGAFLQGIGSLMLIPALAGVGASCVCLWCGGKKKDLPHGILLGLILAACAVLTVLNLVTGIPALAANFGG